MEQLTASVRKSDGGHRWVGVLRNSKGKVVWECGHAHENHDCRGRKGKPAHSQTESRLTASA
jgi:hypothetical protein